MGPGYFGRTQNFFLLFCAVMKFFTSFWWGHEIFSHFFSKKNLLCKYNFDYFSIHHRNEISMRIKWVWFLDGFPDSCVPDFPDMHEVTMCDVKNVRTFCTLVAMRPCLELLLELNLTFQVLFYEFLENIRQFIGIKNLTEYQVCTQFHQVFQQSKP